DRVADGLQLLAPVAVLGRLDFSEEIPQVEEAIDAAQEHLQLEEDLLAAGDVQRTDPALAFRQVDGPDPLRVAHQLEEKVLRERALVGAGSHQSSEPCSPVGGFLPRCSKARWVA